MFKKVLIANRGEIAVRIIRACRELGIHTVAVYSLADAHCLHTQLADEAICIGPASPRDSYLNMYNILSATILSGADAIHPGFGFLSENSKFANMCAKCNITFIGPSADVMDRMGHKMNARKSMIKAGVPVIPGSGNILKDEEEALKIAAKVGYPIMIKASAGGGGRGIRRVEKPEELDKAFDAAKAEAEVCFGDGSLYLEKCIEDARHIEFQIMADNFGNVVHLGERDCSMQRRNQKVLEESPSTFIGAELRKLMGNAAVRAAKAVKYCNAGTVEFLVDSQHRFYFMEMNTRIQVEHPVTEMVTGRDLIKEQIRVAAGEKLSFAQKDITLSGHAIECRINAEDPAHGFRPSAGTVKMLHIPGGPGVRFDTMLYQGYAIPPHYDSMLGKLIVHANNRQEAINKMKTALAELVVDGVIHNIDFQLEILESEDFMQGNFTTAWIGKRW